MRASKSTLAKDGQQSRWVVYRYFAGDGTLLYVGATSQWAVRDRRHRVEKPWYKDVARFELEHHDDRMVAAQREADVIQRECPLHNRRSIVVRPPDPPLGSEPVRFTIAIHASTARWLYRSADAQNVPVSTFIGELLDRVCEWSEEQQTGKPRRAQESPGRERIGLG
jgi:hypothetical protein